LVTRGAAVWFVRLSATIAPSSNGQLVSPTHRPVLLRGQHLRPAQGPDFDQRKDPTYGTGGIVHFVEVNPMPKAGGT